MNLPVFLSVSTPYTKDQEQFYNNFVDYMDAQGFEPRTVGRTDYSISEPLTSCRMLMMESYGLITLAFRRYYVRQGWENYAEDKSSILVSAQQKSLKTRYFTSPWCHIEAAMAYQLGLPILIFREEGVLPKGLLRGGITNTYLPVFRASEFNTYFKNDEFQQCFGQWSGYVRNVRANRSKPPRLYDL